MGTKSIVAFVVASVRRLKAQGAPDVVFLGYVHGTILEALFSHASVLVLPSSLEGLSITLLEGLGYGRCCLVSDIPPNLEAAAGNAVVLKPAVYTPLVALELGRMAQEAGVPDGARILTVNGQPVDSFRETIDHIAAWRPDRGSCRPAGR